MTLLTLLRPPDTAPPPPPPSPWIPRVDCNVYARAGGLLTTLPDLFNPKTFEPLNDTGTGEVSIPAVVEPDESTGPTPNPERTLVPYGSLLRFTLDGNPIFQSLVEEVRTKTVAVGEEQAETTTFSGRGAAAVMEESVVYPFGGLGWTPFSDKRTFDFSSPELDEAGWPNAVQIKQQGNPFDPYGGAPANWPDPNAWWIWGVGGPLPYPVGYCYFKKRIYLPAETNVRFFIAADDGFDLRVDGASLASTAPASNSPSFTWGTPTQVDLFLGAGVHTIAIRGQNIARPSSPSTNAAAVIFTCYQVGANGALVAPPSAPSGPVLPIVSSDNTWKCQAYPTTAPALPLGEVLHFLFDEAVTRGGMGSVVLGFGQTLDTNGNAWPTEEVSFNVGDSLLAVLKQLAATYLDFRMAPDSLTLNAYVSLGATPGVSLVPGTNLTSLDFDGKV